MFQLFVQQQVFSCGRLVPTVFAIITSLLWFCETSSAKSEIRFGGSGASSVTSMDEVSHAAWDALLNRYVDCTGMVCYRKWQSNHRDVQQLEGYLQELALVDSSLPSTREAMMAYYINAYNAMTVWGILREYPVASIQRIDGKRTPFSIFDDVQLWDGVAYRSLNGIENDVLRPLGDPRIHFALVCAARGCPRLRNRAYTSPDLPLQLDDNAREFFAKHGRFHVSRLTGTVHMSPILDWYRDDFGKTDHQVVSTVFQYLPKDDRIWLSQHGNWKFKYLGYDWSLNDGFPTMGVGAAAIPYRAFSKFSPLIKPLTKLLKKE